MAYQISGALLLAAFCCRLKQFFDDRFLVMKDAESVPECVQKVDAETAICKESNGYWRVRFLERCLKKKAAPEDLRDRLERCWE